MGAGFPNQRVGVNVSAGGSLVQSGTVVFSNSNGVTFGVQASASSTVLTMSVGAVGAISAGTTQVTSGTVSFANSNGISFGLNGQTLTAQMPSVTFFVPAKPYDSPNAMVVSSSTLNISVQRVSVPLSIRATRVDILANLTIAASAAGTMQFTAGLYTMTGSTASLVSSATYTRSFSSGNGTDSTLLSNGYNHLSGTRWRTLSPGGGTWVVTPGDYMFALLASIAPGGSLTAYGASGISINPFDGRTESGTLGNFGFNYFGDGLFSTGSAALPATFQMSDINQTGAAVLAQPYFRLAGTV